MRLAWVALLAASSCVSIHTVDLGGGRQALSPSCQIPLNRGGPVPEGWKAIGRVEIEGGSDWTDERLGEEIRQQACELGAEYVVLTGTPDYWVAELLVKQEL
ncbi:MAG: hypothetical protein JNG84_09365 [Archangium sp.]|nr:hypothetical protein [Archangium sp.]